MNTYELHRNSIARYLEEKDIVIIFAGKAPKSTADALYEFKTNKNFYYFTGIDREGFILAMHKTAQGVESTLFIEKPNYDIEKWTGKKLSMEESKALSAVEDIRFLDHFDTWINGLIANGKIEKVWLDLEKVNYDETHSFANLYAKKLLDSYPFLSIKTIHPAVTELRMIKSEAEINLVKEAIHLTNLGLKEVLGRLKALDYEYQVASTFEHTLKMNGADGISFQTIAASGDDGVILHYVSNKKKLSNDRLILLDLGAQYKEYAADISRTYPINGRYTKRQREIYEIVLKAQSDVIEAMKPGLPFKSLNEICKTSFIKSLKEIGLIERDEELSKYYYHGVSHHLGLDVHDLGDRDGFLKAGMILTVEPGLYIAQEGIGIRIEDDVLITQTGNEVLSSEIPKQIVEIERLLNATS